MTLSDCYLAQALNIAGPGHVHAVAPGAQTSLCAHQPVNWQNPIAGPVDICPQCAAALTRANLGGKS